MLNRISSLFRNSTNDASTQSLDKCEIIASTSGELTIRILGRRVSSDDLGEMAKRLQLLQTDFSLLRFDFSNVEQLTGP